MFEYARRFDAVIRSAGATTCIFMTSARRNEQDRLPTIATACDELGAELGCTVAPIGLAWARSLDARPELELHLKDNLHATQHAAYLNAWGSGDLSADFDGNGVINTADFAIFLSEWSAGCP